MSDFFQRFRGTSRLHPASEAGEVESDLRSAQRAASAVNLLTAEGLAAAPKYLDVIDRAEAQIRAGTMTPLDQVIDELDFGSDASNATIVVSVPIGEVIDGWIAKGSSISVNSSYDSGALVSAQAFDPDASLIMRNVSVAESGEMIEELKEAGVEVTLSSVDAGTEISVGFVTPSAGVEQLRLTVENALETVKTQVERPAPGRLGFGHRLGIIGQHGR